MALASVDFDYVRGLVQRDSAIVLDAGKEYLVEARLAPLVASEGFNSLSELVSSLRSRPSAALQQKVIDCMTTNESSFFRDIHPFEALRKTILPNLIARRQTERRLSIWCGACSSGQEPYTVAMILRENFPALLNWRVDIHATDISPTMLARARAGKFNQLEVNRGLPAPLLVKYFHKFEGGWQIREDLRTMIQFKDLNLAKPWPLLPNFDLVLMRNVLIYFDLATKREIFARIRKVLRTDGTLFLGGAETTVGIDDSFDRNMVGTAVCYRMRGAPSLTDPQPGMVPTTGITRALPSVI